MKRHKTAAGQAQKLTNKLLPALHMRSLPYTMDAASANESTDAAREALDQRMQAMPVGFFTTSQLNR